MDPDPGSHMNPCKSQGLERPRVADTRPLLRNLLYTLGASSAGVHPPLLGLFKSSLLMVYSLKLILKVNAALISKFSRLKCE